MRGKEVKENKTGNEEEVRRRGETVRKSVCVCVYEKVCVCVCV